MAVRELKEKAKPDLEGVWACENRHRTEQEKGEEVVVLEGKTNPVFRRKPCKSCGCPMRLVK